MIDLPELFPGFETRRVRTQGAEIQFRTGGKGPPLLLLHGYPQTHACWHRIAPALAKQFTLVIPDLRGYGQSSAPPGDPEHRIYSKRAMAQDCVDVMAALGHNRFAVAGHDRGGRVAYRLALDHEQAVTHLAVLDIVPTSEAWDAMDFKGAMSKFHWTFLAQPQPLPETIIEASPRVWHEHLIASWSGAGDLSAFDDLALAHYRASFTDPARIHAMCEDYRAGITVDYELDHTDLRAGRKISCPTLALWGERRSVGTVSNTLAIWGRWCRQVDGRPIHSGHFLAEENHVDTLSALVPFLSGMPAPT